MKEESSVVTTGEQSVKVSRFFCCLVIILEFLFSFYDRQMKNNKILIHLQLHSMIHNFSEMFSEIYQVLMLIVMLYEQHLNKCNNKREIPMITMKQLRRKKMENRKISNELFNYPIEKNFNGFLCYCCCHLMC